ncbi:hypothetical protein ABB37_07310 [Leptomonas pyrrhocoris]|uniref:Uncharacterized protein n=1 Tax=Leptomonas pyrrhocoris TaxID=157538 RepID=A0A0N0DTD3_LEPPY|nr:hypothetical protein ABB37_07310 [Leptomonas pyrrhocoris]KPA76931.1 hypothetical protein ABB37_07310 [Leptomonas pyrrhocoris]|eukprot:XP_015655370.1 hypothetical protein ABB37_07310 [Leptomonas pyrrhocoris]
MTEELGLTPSPLSAVKHRNSTPSPTSGTTEGAWDRTTFPGTPEVLIDDQDAMDYLLTVFSSIKKTAEVESEVPRRKPAVMRQLFHEHRPDNVSQLPPTQNLSEKLAFRATGVHEVHRPTRVAEEENGSAGDASVDEAPLRSPSPSPLKSCGASFSLHQSASELVEEMIQFFTV